MKTVHRKTAQQWIDLLAETHDPVRRLAIVTALYQHLLSILRQQPWDDWTDDEIDVEVPQ